jgi:hypothetical protein
MQKHLVNEVIKTKDLNVNMSGRRLLSDTNTKQKNKSDCRHCSKEFCSKRNAAYEID